MGFRGREVHDGAALAGMRTSATTVALAPAHEPPGRDPLATVAVTAEIPPVPLSAAPPRTAVATPAGTVVTRRPAPVPLRQAVWFLVFVLALCGGGLWALHARPSWFAFLRNQVGPTIPLTTPGTGSAPSAPSTHTSSTHGSTAPAPLSGFHVAKQSMSPSGFLTATYDTGVTDYSVKVSTSALCWVVVKSPASAAGDVVEATEPAGFHQTVPATVGSLFVEVAAHGATITVVGPNGKVIGTPLVNAHVGGYTFRP